jgi:hypothetical protein
MVLMMEGTTIISVSLAVSMMVVQLLVVQLLRDGAMDAIRAAEDHVLASDAVDEVSTMSFFASASDVRPDYLRGIISQGMRHVSPSLWRSHSTSSSSSSSSAPLAAPYWPL